MAFIFIAYVGMAYKPEKAIHMGADLEEAPKVESADEPRNQKVMRMVHRVPPLLYNHRINA